MKTQFNIDMSKILIARNVQYQGTFLTIPIHISVEIESLYKSTIGFTLYGMLYSFVVTSWQGRGFVD
jgi:hypothetical protein